MLLTQEKIQPIIEQARHFLNEHPFDSGHDLEHHQTVLALAKEIASHILEKIDEHALEIAVMWHDVVIDPNDIQDVSQRGNIKTKTVDYLRKILQQHNFSPALIQEIADAVEFHSYDDLQKNTLGKVLFDADKLSAIDLPRWRKIAVAHDQGKISDSDYNHYLTSGKHWLETMLDKLHFEYSESLFHDRMRAVFQDSWARKFAQELGLDISTYS